MVNVDRSEVSRKAAATRGHESLSEAGRRGAEARTRESRVEAGKKAAATRGHEAMAEMGRKGGQHSHGGGSRKEKEEQVI